MALWVYIRAGCPSKLKGLLESGVDHRGTVVISRSERTCIPDDIVFIIAALFFSRATDYCERKVSQQGPG